MELKDFIEEALTQIVEGVKSAQDKAKEQNAFISPAGVRTNNDNNMRIEVCGKNIPLHQIDFEIALTSSEGKGNKGGIGVFLGNIGLGTQGTSENNNTSMTRIRFSVPILFPFVNPDAHKPN